MHLSVSVHERTYVHDVGVSTEEDLEALLAIGRRHANVYCKLGPLDAFSQQQQQQQQPAYDDLLPYLRQVVTAFGADRCMWESDSGTYCAALHGMY